MPVFAPSMALSSPSVPHFPSSLCKTHPPFLNRSSFPFKPISIKALSTSVNTPTAPSADTLSTHFKTSNWQWKFKENFINIHYEEHKRECPDPPKNIILVPTISDVSTVEEWRLVAKDIVQRVGNVNWRAIIVDWLGLGYSDRPKMDYTADVMEKFLVDFMNAPDGPLGCALEFSSSSAT